jgi:hypothetical protein
VSIQVDNGLSTPTQVYGNYCPQSSIAGGPLTGSNLVTSPYYAYGSASASGVAALGNLSAQGSATGTGQGGASVEVEVSFNDELTISPSSPSGPLAFEIVFDPVGSVSVVGGEESGLGSGEAAMTAGFEGSDGERSSVATGVENVCLESIQVVSSCGPGYQETSSPLTGVFDGQAGDQIQLYGYLNMTVLADGTFYCNPYSVPCLNPVSGSASAQFDAPFYVESLTPGVTFSSLSGHNYSAPEPSSLVLLAMALAALVGFVHRTAPRRAWLTPSGEWEVVPPLISLR